MKNICNKRSFLIGLPIFVFFHLLFTSFAIGQSGKSSTVVLSDSVVFHQEENNSLLQTITPAFRLRENRTKYERDRIVNLIRNLIDSGDLSIDSLTVNLIIEDLLRFSNDSSQSWEEIQKIQDELIGLIDTLGFESANRKEILKKLVQLKAIQIKCDPQIIPSEGKAINDSTFLCLTTKAKVFGWQDANLDPNVIQSYNFEYLTDIIYHGYELGPDGNSKNEKLLNNLLIDRTLATLVQKNGIKLSLSIFSNSATTIGSFLGNANAQETLIMQLKEILKKAPIDGINIYFENLPIKDQNDFSAFVQDLRNEFSKDKSFLITLSLPPISSDKDIEKVRAYDLESLGPLVDYFLIQTDKVKLLNDEFPGSPSPLYKLEAGKSASIATTLDFYSNWKLPKSKMVITVSYLGITWPVSDFIEGSRAIGLGKYMGFKEIKEYFGDLEKFEKAPIYEFDTVMVSSYFQYFEKGKMNILWFEDGNSLYKKYNFAVEENLGGVAIWGLGYDEGYVELWDALGAAMVKVDTVIVSKKPSESEKKSYWDRFWIAMDFGTVLLIFMVVGVIIGVILLIRKK